MPGLGVENASKVGGELYRRKTPILVCRGED